MTPLGWACLKGHLQLSQMLLKANADPLIKAHSGVLVGKTAITLARLHGSQSSSAYRHAQELVHVLLMHCGAACFQAGTSHLPPAPASMRLAISLSLRPSSPASTSRVCCPSSGPAHTVWPGSFESFGQMAGTLSGRPPTGTSSNMPRASYCASPTMSSTA